MKRISLTLLFLLFSVAVYAFSSGVGSTSASATVNVVAHKGLQLTLVNPPTNFNFGSNPAGATFDVPLCVYHSGRGRYNMMLTSSSSTQKALGSRFILLSPSGNQMEYWATYTASGLTETLSSGRASTTYFQAMNQTSTTSCLTSELGKLQFRVGAPGVTYKPGAYNDILTVQVNAE